MLRFLTIQGREELATAPGYKVGDTVKLKSGGPVMTVNAVPREHARYYACHWFAGKKLDHGHFQFEELLAASPEAPLKPADEKK